MNDKPDNRRCQVAVLSFSRIVQDRRVLRQCALLSEMGHKPLVVAYADPSETIPFQLQRWPAPKPTTVRRLATVARQVPAHLGLRAAQIGFWSEARNRWALQSIVQAAPRVIIANDWPALVVAAAYSSRSDVHVHYDTHEFATLEFDESAWWRLVYKPMVTQLEASCIDAAASISTVGPKLAEALQSYYRLPRLPAVVRNIPERIPLPEAIEVSWPLRILYHGRVLPDRGLEALIDSIPFWQERHRLTVRGDGDARYMTTLKARIAAVGGVDRVAFEDAVSPEEVMPLASRTADLGVHFTPLDTSQRHFSLPNKLFEYIGAGLAVAVSPGVDMKKLVESHGVGVVSQDATAQAVAKAINGLTKASVASFKAAARTASRTLCWEKEREILRSELQLLLQRV